MREAVTPTTEVRARDVWAGVLIAAVMCITGIVLGQLPHDEFGIPSGTAASITSVVCGAGLTLILSLAWWRPSQSMPTRGGILLGAAAASLGLTLLVNTGVWVVRLVLLG
jgi:hypothetical protein